MKQKAFFIIFKGLSVVRDCPKPESGPLKDYNKITLVKNNAIISNKNM